MRDYTFTFNTAEFATMVEMLEEAVELSKQRLFSIEVKASDDNNMEPVKTFFEEVECRRTEFELREKILNIVKDIN